MIVKDIIDEQLLTLAEVKEKLELILEERKNNNNEEQVYEFRKALNHATMFSKISAAESREIIDKLLVNEKINLSIAVRIADILPLSNDEIRSIFSKEKYILKDEDLQFILDIVKNYA